MLVVALAVTSARAQVTEPQVQALENQLSQLEGEMGRVEALWAGPVDLTTNASFEERLSQGELYYILNMYEQASLVLYGAVSPPDRGGRVDASLVNRPGYLDGMYQLAESLLALGNYAGARAYFEQLLKLPGHSYRGRAITALMEISTKLRDYSKLDEYYEQFRAASGGDIPGEIRYLHGKSLLIARRDQAALDELSSVAKGNSHYLRAQYMMAAVLVRQAGSRGVGGELADEQRQKLESALELFTRITKDKAIAREDKQVIELAHLARGRIFYELDRLVEAIDAYQYIPWDSPVLPTMLYEATWTYVRRGQLALYDETLTEAERRKKALDEYELALQQLDDLRALEPEGERAAEIELLAGNLRIQRGEFTEAEILFEDLRKKWWPVDAQLSTLMSDPSRRDRVLDDILAMEAGGLAVDSQLPPLAARRAASDDDVRDAIRVFREIQLSREEILATEKMLAKLEALVTSENRAERFPQLRTMLSRALTLENNVLGLRGQAADLQVQSASSLSADLRGRLEQLRAQRTELQQKVESLPTTGEALEERRSDFDKGFARLDQELHNKSLELNALRAQLNALDLLYTQAQGTAATAPQALDNTKRKLQELRAIVEDLEKQERTIQQEIDGARLSTTMSGGQGASERDLREALQRILDEEKALLSSLTGPLADRIRAADGRAARLRERNKQFLARLYRAVDEHVASIKRVIDEERRNLTIYAGLIEQVDQDASSIREIATTIALEHVRADLHDIVVRSDVGLIDVSFAKKQLETEKIGRLQRAKTLELTELNQAYADLNRDELQ